MINGISRWENSMILSAISCNFTIISKFLCGVSWTQKFIYFPRIMTWWWKIKNFHKDTISSKNKLQEVRLLRKYTTAIPSKKELKSGSNICLNNFLLEKRSFYRKSSFGLSLYSTQGNLRAYEHNLSVVSRLNGIIDNLDTRGLTFIEANFLEISNLLSMVCNAKVEAFPRNLTICEYLVTGGRISKKWLNAKHLAETKIEENYRNPQSS